MFEVFEVFWSKPGSWQAHCSDSLDTKSHRLSADMNHRHHPPVEVRHRLSHRPPSSGAAIRPVHLLVFMALLTGASARAQTTNSPIPPLHASSVIEVAGQVDYSAAGAT